MNASELASALLEWEKKRRELNALEVTIEAAVLKLGKTQTVGSVRASYSAGKKKYNYEAAYDAAVEVAGEKTQEDLASKLVDHIKTSFDFRAICQECKITDIPYEQADPSVSIKLVD